MPPPVNTVIYTYGVIIGWERIGDPYTVFSPETDACHLPPMLFSRYNYLLGTPVSFTAMFDVLKQKWLVSEMSPLSTGSVVRVLGIPMMFPRRLNLVVMAYVVRRCTCPSPQCLERDDYVGCIWNDVIGVIDIDHEYMEGMEHGDYVQCSVSYSPNRLVECSKWQVFDVIGIMKNKSLLLDGSNERIYPFKHVATSIKTSDIWKFVRDPTMPYIEIVMPNRGSVAAWYDNNNPLLRAVFSCQSSKYINATDQKVFLDRAFKLRVTYVVKLTGGFQVLLVTLLGNDNKPIDHHPYA